MNALTVQGLTKQYPNFVLDNISFSVPGGSIMGLIGKNGAGKSTTLKCMLNLVNADEGAVTMLGQNIYTHEELIKQNIGVVLGEIDFYQHKKLRDITAVTKRFYKNWDDALYKTYLDMFELDEKKAVKELSSGMRVKYMLALALSHKAQLLILDEPTSGLDPVSRDDLLSLFRALVKKGERSILFSTHITSDLEKCADHITYIQKGKLLASSESAAFAAGFEHLRQPGEVGPLSLEDIMLRSERRHYHV